MQLMGAISVVYGIWCIYHPAAWLTAGVAIILMGEKW